LGPTGNTGAPGPTGPAGNIGQIGPTGNVGPTGPAGNIGQIGPTGNLGPTGPQGAQGLIGPTGAVGGPGSQGAQGLIGPTGAGGGGGPQGAQGPQGGPGGGGPGGPGGGQGAQGPQGPQGPQGAQGAAGYQGYPGPTGPSAVTCYGYSVTLGSNNSFACYGPAYSSPYLYSQTSSCSSSGNVYFFYLYTSCQTSAISWPYGATYMQCGGVTGYIDGSGYWQPSYFCYSDVRTKQLIETLKNSLEVILKLETVEYDWNEKTPNYEYFEKRGRLHAIGLIAQDVRQYFPEVVKMSESGYYMIEYPKLNAVLVEGIKEQQVFIEDINKQIDELESKIK
jgi:hypothetical protein